MPVLSQLAISETSADTQQRWRLIFDLMCVAANVILLGTSVWQTKKNFDDPGYTGIEVSPTRRLFLRVQFVLQALQQTPVLGNRLEC